MRERGKVEFNDLVRNQILSISSQFTFHSLNRSGHTIAALFSRTSGMNLDSNRDREVAYSSDERERKSRVQRPRSKPNPLHFFPIHFPFTQPLRAHHRCVIFSNLRNES